MTHAATGEARSPWTNAYGLARSALAFGTLLTLLFNDTTLLFHPLGGEPNGNFGRDGLLGWSLFFLVPTEMLEAARWACAAVLAVVVSGWRPRITGLLHWYISFSFAAATVVVDGGDHIATVLTLLLLPVTLIDPRRWHWSAPAAAADERVAPTLAREVALSALLVVRLQVALVYFHASIGKMGAPEWADGTALYYWFSHPVFGAAPWLENALIPFLSSPLLVTAFTWGVIIFELVLFLGLTMDRRWWPPLLAAGLAFHFGIILVHGLVSFFFSMAGALLLYLRPFDQPYRLPAFAWRPYALPVWLASLRVRLAGTRAVAG